MTELAVDASVAIKWFVPEVHAASARKLLAIDFDLITPDLMPIEVASIVWKKRRRGELAADQAIGIIEDLTAFPIEIVDSVELLPGALELAMASDRTVYDCLYLALAIERGCQFVTVDMRFKNALSNTAHGERVIHIQDLPV